jgi:hypothetical protein
LNERQLSGSLLNFCNDRDWGALPIVRFDRPDRQLHKTGHSLERNRTSASGRQRSVCCQQFALPIANGRERVESGRLSALEDAPLKRV